MKKIFLVFTLFSAISIISFAQTRNANPQRVANAPKISATPAQKDVVKDAPAYAERISRDLQKKLNLSEDQYKQILDINLRFVNEQNAARTSGNVDLNRIAELKRRRDDELKGALSPGQFNQFMEMRNTKKGANAKDVDEPMNDANKTSTPVKPERK
jgi:hypothetical protein